MTAVENKNDLLREMKTAKGSRFNAAERLRKRDRNRTYITSAATVAVIMITILPLTFHLSQTLVSIFNFMTIMMSVIILVYSLLQYATGDLVAADQHHRCALEINALRRKLRSAAADDETSVDRIAGSYDDILQRYSINHDPVDFQRYKLEHSDEFNESDEEKKRERKDVKSSSAIEVLVENFVNITIFLAVLFAFILSLRSTEIFKQLDYLIPK